jgi:hypothetical protein
MLTNTKLIPRYAHIPVLGTYNYKPNTLIPTTPSKKQGVKQPFIVKNTTQAQKENSNSFSNTNNVNFINKAKQVNTMKSYIKDINHKIISRDDKESSRECEEHLLYSKRKDNKVKSRRVGSNEIKGMMTLNQNDNVEYSVTYENEERKNAMIYNGDEINNQIGMYLKNVAVHQQSYMKKRTINKSYFKVNANNYNNNNNMNINNNTNNNNNNISFIVNPTMNTNNMTNNNSSKPNKVTSSSNEVSEYFDYSDEKVPELTKEEKDTYGNREMKGYQKQRLLGK